jgi:prepilin-type processing-associated H-X9-DG protein
VNGYDNAAYGVCLNSSGTFNTSPVPIAHVGLDYIGSHDGTSFTLLLSETVLDNPQPPMVPRLADARSTNGSTTGDDGMWNVPTVSNNVTQNDELALGFSWGGGTTSSSGGTFTVPGTTVGWRCVTTSTPKLTDVIMSRHSGGGFNVSFCDGRNLFMQSNGDYKVFAQLMTPWGKMAGQTTVLDESAAGMGP